MQSAFNKRLLIVWLAPASLKLAYLWIDQTVDHHGAPSHSAVVTSTAIALLSPTSSEQKELVGQDEE
jgi:hypothetical protein